MFSAIIIFSFLVLFVPLISGKKVLCKNGERIYEEDLIYDCIEGKKVYYGCKIDGIEYKLNTTKDEGNLRHFLCFKRYNDVRPNVVIGCVTDDGIFINETKTVQQKDGFQFNCTKNGRIFTFTKTPPPPPHFPPTHSPHHPSKPLSDGCKLGETKLVSNRFILKCQKKKNEEQNAFHLTACYPQPKYGNNKMKRAVKVEVGKTFDTFVNKNAGLGYRSKCHSKGDKYFYDEVGCIVGKEFVKPDEIFFNGTDAILCIQKNLGKLQLKAINPKKLVQKLCSKSSEESEMNDKKRCPNSWTLNEKTGFCYKLFSNANFEDAKKKCEKEESTLASIHSFEEAQFIADLSHDPEAETWDWKNQAWIGLYSPENSLEWKWIDGTPFDYTKWSKNEPDNLNEQKCGYIRFAASSKIEIAKKGDLQNIGCKEVLAKFVCKKASV